jgi:hypothetical protein
MRPRFFSLSLTIAAFVSSGLYAQTAITYQGELRSGGVPASGVYDLRFRLFDDAQTGNQVGSTLCLNNVSVTDGRFTASLDFGGVYTAPRFLAIEVRADTGLGCGDAAGYTLLSPRQSLAPAPSATYAPNAGEAALFGGQSAFFYRNASNLNSGTISDSLVSSNIPRLNFTSTFTAIPAFNGGTPGSSAPFSVDSNFRVSNLNADLLDGLDATAFATASHTHDAAAIVSGTVADARLPSNLGRLNVGQNWTGANVFSGNNVFAGDGAGLTNLNAGQLVSGSVPDSRLPSTVARLGVGNTFTAAQTVNIGAAQTAMTLTGGNTQGTWLTISNTAARSWNIIASSTNNGEGAGKLVFRDATAGAVRMTLDTDGDVGIGTSTPAGRFDVTGTDPRFALRNTNDPGGGYLQQTFNALQLGLYNPGASAWGVVPASGSRALFGVDSTGRVGSLTNTGPSPAFRNLLDNGSGNATIQGNLSARNMPAMKFVRSDTPGSLESDSTTLIENISVNIPADGYLKITAQCHAQLTAYNFQIARATLELKETTNGEVVVRDAVYSIRPGDATAIQTWQGVMTLEYNIPVSAGVRSYKLRLVFSDDGGISLNSVSYSGSEVSVLYVPGSL